MEKERLAILRAEVEAQIKEIENIYGKLEERRRKRGKAAIESIAYQMHNLYCAFEDLFKIVAANFENNIEDMVKYHTELLKRMTLTIEGVRPPLLSNEIFVLLDNLRSFRHFFRHAYSYEMDERKVRIVMEDVLKLKEIYRKDISIFLDSLSVKT